MYHNLRFCNWSYSLWNNQHIYIECYRHSEPFRIRPVKLRPPYKSKFIELTAAEKIVIQHISASRFTLSISALHRNEGTQLLWESEFDDPKVADAVRHIAEPGMEQNLDRLHLFTRGELE